MVAAWARMFARFLQPGKAQFGAPFRRALEALVRDGDTVNILQAGANDGVIKDPLHRFLRAHPDRTQIILVEPQVALIPALTDAYVFHPRHAMVPVAVGAAGTLVLRKVRVDCWPDLVLGYGKDWPAYRAPTGVASGQRETLLLWVDRHCRGQLAAKDVIETVEVESVPTATLMARTGLFDRLDVLQIDVEGCDDLVVRASDIAGLQPKLIHFEAAHLSAARLILICAELEGFGCETRQHGPDCLATRRKA